MESFQQVGSKPRFTKVKTPVHFIVAMCLFAAALPAYAQDEQSTLRALLLQAESQNSLESEGVRPFELSATYEISDYLAKPTGSGELTVRFLKPGVRKAVANEIPSSTGSMTPDEQLAHDFMRHLLVDLLLHPSPSEAQVQASTLKLRNQKIGTLPLRCVELRSKNGKERAPANPAEVACLSEDKPLVRLVELTYGFEVIYNNFVRFEGRTFAKEVVIQERGKTRAKLMVNNIALAPTLTESDFSMPDEFADLSRGRRTNQGATSNHPEIVKQTQPEFPPGLSSPYRGSAYMRAVIGTNGSVVCVGIISAAAKGLADASVKTVRQWQFKPATVNGRPMEQSITIGIDFQRL